MKKVINQEDYDNKSETEKAEMDENKNIISEDISTVFNEYFREKYKGDRVKIAGFVCNLISTVLDRAKKNEDDGFIIELNKYLKQVLDYFEVKN